MAMMVEAWFTYGVFLRVNLYREWIAVVMYTSLCFNELVIGWHHPAYIVALILIAAIMVVTREYHSSPATD